MMAMDRSALGIVIGLEARKLARATVTRVATIAALTLVTVTTAGGYAAAMHAGDTDMGRKAASMVTSPGWDGYTGLGATSVSATILLAVGVVMSWSVGREFTDGTIVGLFAIPPTLRTIATAKMVVVTLFWAVLLGAGEAALLMTAGLLLGLGAAGAAGCFATLLLVSVVLSAGVLPVMWAATWWRGYLAGIGLTLAILVVTKSGRRVRARFLRPVVHPDRVGLAPDGGQHAVADDTGDDRRDRRLDHLPVLGPPAAGRRLSMRPLPADVQTDVSPPGRARARAVRRTRMTLRRR